jgi:hypothetical protein
MIEELHEGFKQNVIHFSIDQLRDQLGPLDADRYMKYKKHYPLSSVIKGYENNLDLLIIEESYLWFENDLTIPVMYYHTEPHMACTVKWPTHILYKNMQANDFLHSLHPWGWHTVKWKATMYPCVHPPFWMPDHPKDVQCSFIGAPSDMFDRKRDWMWTMMQKDHWEIVGYINNHNLCTVIDDLGDEPVIHRTYNEYIARSKHMILTSFNGVYMGRRTMECLASKCIPIIWIESDKSEQFHRSLGFIPHPELKSNCYFYRKKEELPKLANMEYDPVMAHNGYELMINNHTFGHRALTIMRLIERTCTQLQVKLPPSNGLYDEFAYKNRAKMKVKVK